MQSYKMTIIHIEICHKHEVGNMKTYIISCISVPSQVPFRIEAHDADEALQKVFDHMGSENYRVVSVQ